MTTSFIEHLPTAHYRSSRDERSSAAVLRATLAELDDRGYASASLRTIAARAEVPLETVFSQWRSKQHLVHDAIEHLAASQPRPETGDVRADLLQVAEALIELLTHAGAAQVLRSMVAAVDGDGAAGVALRIGGLGERRAGVRRIVERGQRRQQFPSSLHPGLVADALIGGVVYRLLVSNESLNTRTAAGLVDAIVVGQTDA